MMVVGITGGIGSGKSLVCSVFCELGIPVYEADTEAKKLYGIPEVKAEVKKEFGERIFNASGELNRKKLAELVFQNETDLKKINKIIHPYVKQHFRDWKKLHREKRYVLKEAAILFESGTDKGCEKIIVVTAPEDLRIQRVMSRDHRSQEEVKKIIQKQWPEQELVKRADYVIENDEKKLILPQVLRIHSEIISYGLE